MDNTVGQRDAMDDVGMGIRGQSLSILANGLSENGSSFGLQASRQRLASSFVFSLGSHVFALAVLLFLISLTPQRVFETIEANRENYGLVWLPVEGPGGGGGGGGDESLELPSQVEVEGPDEADLAIPVEDPVEFEEPQVEPEEQLIRTQQLNIPAVSITNDMTTRPGLLEGLMANSLSRGSDGGAGDGDGGGIGPGKGNGLGPGEGGGVGGGIFRPGNGVNPPRLLQEVKPRYTAEAMRAKIQGTVWLEVVVLPDGSVGDILVTKSLDSVFGLDQQAMNAAKQWRFSPGTRFGEPVSVLVGLELYFNLR